jgi:hypothetical protein
MFNNDQSSDHPSYEEFSQLSDEEKLAFMEGTIEKHIFEADHKPMMRHTPACMEWQMKHKACTLKRRFLFWTFRKPCPHALQCAKRAAIIQLTEMVTDMGIMGMMFVPQAGAIKERILNAKSLRAVDQALESFSLALTKV